MEQIGKLMTGGDFYVLGQKFSAKAVAPASLLDDLVNYLVTNTYSKLPMPKVRQADAAGEIRAVLAASDLAQRNRALGGEGGNPAAIQEVREYLHLTATQNRVLLSDVVDRFSGTPYGWKPDARSCSSWRACSWPAKSS